MIACLQVEGAHLNNAKSKNKRKEDCGAVVSNITQQGEKALEYELGYPLFTSLSTPISIGMIEVTLGVVWGRTRGLVKVVRVLYSSQS